jgi:hypothetical protein
MVAPAVEGIDLFKIAGRPFQDGSRASKRAPLSGKRSVANSKNVSFCGSNIIPR